MNAIENIIKALDLKPHPEGGFFKETYRSKDEFNEGSLNPDYKGERNYATCIYFLLTSDIFSAFHRIKQDEIWHFYSGSPIRLHILSEKGTHSTHIIGNDLAAGHLPQFVVPGSSWFGATVMGKHNYALVGCTVSPGFDFDDFELATRRELTALFPEHKKIIRELTHP